MKIETINKYVCETCGKKHNTADEANQCEAIPVTHDRGVKVGDKVRITAGDGEGLLCTVESVHIQHAGWGLSRYDHAIYLTGKVEGSWGNRMLTHDSYEVVEGEFEVEWTPCIKLPVVVHVRKQRLGEAHISTREGITPVKPDDLIMRGVSGEEYPIGRAIFEQTYSLDTTPPQRKPLTDQTIELKATNLENATSDVKWGFEQGAKWARGML